MLKTRPMILMVRPATAVPRLVDFIPFKDMTSPTIVIGRPNIGRSQATNPMMPKTRPAVALPVGLSIGFGGCVFSIVCCVLCLRKMSSGLTFRSATEIDWCCRHIGMTRSMDGRCGPVKQDFPPISDRSRPGRCDSFPTVFSHRPLDDHRGAAGFVAGRQHHEHFTAPLAPTAKAKPKRARKV